MDDSLEEGFHKQVTGKKMVRLIKKDVGIDKTNDKDDVKAIVDKLREMEIITEAEKDLLSTEKLDEKLLGEVIIRYQKRVFTGIKDGEIGAGGKTEKKIYMGEKGTAPAKESKKE